MRRDLRPIIFYEDYNLFGQNSLHKYGRILITYLRSCGSIISLDRTTQVETSHTIPCIPTVHVAIRLVTGGGHQHLANCYTVKVKTMTSAHPLSETKLRTAPEGCSIWDPIEQITVQLEVNGIQFPKVSSIVII